MRVFIQKANDNEFVNENCYSAFIGFSQMGFEICTYKNLPPQNLNKEDIVVGHIGSVRTALRNLHITPPVEIDYPLEISKYLHRKIWKSTIHTIANNQELWPVFVKSVSGKIVTGFVCDSIKSLSGKGSPYDFDVWCSEPVRFVSEYRCFIKYKSIIDIRKYTGNYNLYIDTSIVEECVKDYISAPAAYVLDFGVTIDNKTVLIEVNDGYSVGSYGLNSLEYAKFISARWCEMVNVNDLCLF